MDAGVRVSILARVEVVGGDGEGGGIAGAGRWWGAGDAELGEDLGAGGFVFDDGEDADAAGALRAFEDVDVEGATTPQMRCAVGKPRCLGATPRPAHGEARALGGRLGGIYGAGVVRTSHRRLADTAIVETRAPTRERRRAGWAAGRQRTSVGSFRAPPLLPRG